jgi:hypothetical protein
MQAKIVAHAEVLALGTEHLQPVGIVEHEQVAVRIGGEGGREVEREVELAVSLFATSLTTSLLNLVLLSISLGPPRRALGQPL